MSAPIDIGYVARVLQKLLIETGLPVVLEDKASGTKVVVPYDSAVAADGLLPIFLSSGEALWCDASGAAPVVKLEKDIGAYFNWRVKEIGRTKFTALMLAMMEAIAQAKTAEGIMVAELGLVFDEAVTRIIARQEGRA